MINKPYFDIYAGMLIEDRIGDKTDKSYVPQWKEMPLPAKDTAEKLVQYAGETNDEFIKGYFYRNDEEIVTEKDLTVIQTHKAGELPLVFSSDIDIFETQITTTGIYVFTCSEVIMETIEFEGTLYFKTYNHDHLDSHSGWVNGLTIIYTRNDEAMVDDEVFAWQDSQMVQIGTVKATTPRSVTWQLNSEDINLNDYGIILTSPTRPATVGDELTANYTAQVAVYDWVRTNVQPAGSETPTSPDYMDLIHKPAVNDVVLEGDLSLDDLGIAPASLIDDVQNIADEVDTIDTNLGNHTSDTDIHVTASDKINWNNKVTQSNEHNIVYATNDQGTEIYNLKYSQLYTGGTVAVRDSEGCLSVGMCTGSSHATSKLYVDSALAQKLDPEDLDNYVEYDDYATSSKGGVVKINTTNGIDIDNDGALKGLKSSISQLGMSKVDQDKGIDIDTDGYLYTIQATDNEIDGLSNAYKPITPAKLIKALSKTAKIGITAPSISTDPDYEGQLFIVMGGINNPYQIYVNVHKATTGDTEGNVWVRLTDNQLNGVVGSYDWVVIDNKTSNYRVWRNRKLECRGIATSVASTNGIEISLPMSYSDQNYIVHVDVREIGNWFVSCQVTGNQKFNVRISDSYGTPKAVSFSWTTEGYII